MAATRAKKLTNKDKSPYCGALQVLVDDLFQYNEEVRRLDVVIAAESSDLPDDLREVVNILPPGTYTRERLCSQMNSIISGHAWGQVYGTVV